ncbi:unnamed protein product [Amoebophrya sp. A120]|nr:unnamed protein product [Amoebophrya sp. A120]|eukprot:GSA120T00012607001.1
MKVGALSMGRRNRPFDSTKVYCPRRGATQQSDNVNFSPLLKLRLDSAEVPVVFPGAELSGQIVLLRDMHQDMERLEMTLTGRAIAKWWSDGQCYFGREKFIKEKFVVWETERVDGDDTPPHLKPRMTTGGLPVYQTAGREWSFAIKWPMKEIYPPSTTPDGIFKDKAFDKCAGVFYKVKAKLFVRNQEMAQPIYMKTSMYFPCHGTGNVYFSPLARQAFEQGSIVCGSLNVRRETLDVNTGKYISAEEILERNRQECIEKGVESQGFEGGEIISLGAQAAKMRRGRRRRKKGGKAPAGGGASPEGGKKKKAKASKSKSLEGEDAEEDEEAGQKGKGGAKALIDNPFAIRDANDVQGKHQIKADSVPIILPGTDKFCKPPWSKSETTEAVLENVTIKPSCLYLNNIPRTYTSEVEKRAMEKSPSFNRLSRADLGPLPATNDDQTADPTKQPLTISFKLRNCSTSSQRPAVYKKLLVRLTEVVCMSGQPVGSEMTEDDYQDYTLYPPVGTKCFKQEDESNHFEVLQEEWHHFTTTWTSRILHTHVLDSTQFSPNDPSGQDVTIEIPDVTPHLANVIETPDTMRYRSFDEEERVIEVNLSEPNTLKGKNKLMPFGCTSSCSPIHRVLHFLSIEINQPAKETSTNDGQKKSLFESVVQIGRIPISLCDKNMEDRFVWQKKFGLLFGHKTGKVGLLPKPNQVIPPGMMVTDISPGNSCVSPDAQKQKKEDLKIQLPGEEIFMRRNPLSSSTVAEGSEVAARKEKIAEARAKALAEWERQEEENKRLVAERMAPPKGRKVSAAEDDETV